MSLGLILLIAVTIMVFLGLAQRVLDRLNLSDAGALAFIAAMIAGSFLPEIPILRGETAVSINVGGALVALALVIYLLVNASAAEVFRGLMAAAITAAVTFGLAQLTQFKPGQTFIDPLWAFALIAGVVGYLFGRSRRAAFVGGVLGLIINDVIEAVRAYAGGLRTDIVIGGAGIYDAIVLAGLVAVILAELVGETRERLQGGPIHDKDRSIALDNEEFRREEFGDELGHIDPSASTSDEEER